ncbi:hypothetical protein [Micromonospora sp. U21]|uniref:hypothetical protein n=1 Tax=Micromonospora sp. U21 TaxID=2824899 RepID=UPI001B3761EE|nr:hypothetical protein [Micromonospora sp. U21]MBQ0903577.1 hypothetical protein [Micromonospora sp. U21]
MRASIASTWTAVCADLTEKIIRLADEGDAEAAAFRTKVEKARADGLAPAGVNSMQEVERDVLDQAVKLELIDTITKRELDRLRQDRHLCVHPSLRRLGEVYEPRSEVARAHLAIALDSLLTQPPTQGRKVVDEFAVHVCDPLFSASKGHILATFFDRVRPAARRRIVDLAGKHALLELPGLPTVSNVVLAGRMADCLQAFASRDRLLVRDLLSKSVDRLRVSDGELLLRTAARLGDFDVFWELVDAPLSARLDDLVKDMSSAATWDGLTPDKAEVLALARSAEARERIPSLQREFERLSVMGKATVMARHINPYFVPWVPSLLREAGSFRQAEGLTRLAVVPYGPLMTEDDLRDALKEWASNGECRSATGMVQLAVDLYQATVQLRPADRPLWERFLGEVRDGETPDSHYWYSGLEAAMAA